MSAETAAEADVEALVAEAAAAVGQSWPLHSFVTANPLSGFEDRPFTEAVEQGRRLFGGRGYPSAETFRRARADGRIDPETLAAALDAAGYEASPESLLDRMAAADRERRRERAPDPATDAVDRVLSKWLATHLDRGQAEWPMPDREDGFYAAFRAVAPHDRSIPDRAAVPDYPERPSVAVRSLLDDRPRERWPSVVESQFAALPGWTGLVRRHAEAGEGDGDAWASASPVTLVEYLAVRLVLTDLFDAPVDRSPDSDAPTPGDDDAPLPAAWLRAWEATYRRELVEAVAERAASTTEGGDGNDRPDAQLVFCIDTRSEVIRRHVEATGDYETHGYAGFFGIPMRYGGYGDVVTVDACPPIVDAAHRIDDRPVGDSRRRERHDRLTGVREAGRDLVTELASNPATAFSFVETAGGGYGLSLAARTLLPERTYDLWSAVTDRVPAAHEFCRPDLDGRDDDGGTDLPTGLSPDERVEYAAGVFETTGWRQFGRLVAFVGHAGQTANNPFDASLDCGACAGNPGGPSARVLAAVCNDPAVRDRLRDRGIDVPEDTHFLAGEHNTTTDEVALFDGDVPESHREDLERLRADLATARETAAAERTAATGGDPATAVRETERRAVDWAETRPEWGLAGNAALVIGPRSLTADLDLDGRVFLHSYDPATDPDGEALAAILAGPGVVTQWISAQYYFATVDGAVYGSGSKVTQNPVGNVGVYQGNGGDLMTGLPLQSLRAADDELYHQPLRLSVVVHAPVDRVTAALEADEHFLGLLDNGWLSLAVVDPAQGQALEYDGDLAWTPLTTFPTGGADERASTTVEPED
ncbi:DUF2309 domain-containing protein [Halobacteriales archaeon SW_7_71_33]|nr:MAG: DUF2309 domain-containing protein [Halobacteriales archaeon SW_7_71_33]